MANELAGRLWSEDDARPERQPALDSSTLNILLEQYKLYVEMADRVSSRRGRTNTFFLTLNSAAFTLIGIFLSRISPAPLSKIWLILSLVALGIECIAWFWLLRSYRQLNSAKFQVIGEMERRLPASPFWRAEWHALGEGRGRKKYWPLSHLEQWVPFAFLVTYGAGAVAVLAG